MSDVTGADSRFEDFVPVRGITTSDVLPFQKACIDVVKRFEIAVCVDEFARFEHSKPITNDTRDEAFALLAVSGTTAILRRMASRGS